VFVVVYFVIDSVRKLLDTPSLKVHNEELRNFYALGWSEYQTVVHL